MKKLIYILLFFLSISINAQELTAYLYMARFNSPTQGPYIESYLNIIGNTVHFQSKTNGKKQSELEIIYLFKQDGQIKQFKKYVLKSPEINDTSQYFPNFTDQQRILLENGIYNFELSIKDIYDSTKVFKYKDIVSINFDKKIHFSDIEIIDSYKKTEAENIFSKSGIDLIPYASNFFPPAKKDLTFYLELYNTQFLKDSIYLFRYYIKKQGKSNKPTQYTGYKRLKAAPVIPYFKSINISDLESGNYSLMLELINREKKTILKKDFFFQRYNNIVKNNKKDTLSKDLLKNLFFSNVKSLEHMNSYIRCLSPIMGKVQQQQANNAINSKNIEIMKTYFVSFWKNQNPNNPYGDWSIYKENINLINRLYTTSLKKGYETDRGRVYLQYGAPNSISKHQEGAASYPYEVWHYNKIKGERNKVFVFYNSNNVGGDFILLHSDVSAELYNPHWKTDIRRSK